MDYRPRHLVRYILVPANRIKCEEAHTPRKTQAGGAAGCSPAASCGSAFARTRAREPAAARAANYPKFTIMIRCAASAARIPSTLSAVSPRRAREPSKAARTVPNSCLGREYAYTLRRAGGCCRDCSFRIPGAGPAAGLRQSQQRSSAGATGYRKRRVGIGDFRHRSSAVRHRVEPDEAGAARQVRCRRPLAAER